MADWETSCSRLSACRKNCRRRWEQAQKELQTAEVTGTSGGGMAA